MSAAPPRNLRFADLGIRLASGLALAGLALIDLWLGGVWVAALAALAVVLMLWELHGMVTGDRSPSPALVAAAGAGAAAVLVTAPFGLGWALLCLAAGCLAVAALSNRPTALWLCGGLLYGGFALAYLNIIRAAPELGLGAVLWLILVVVAADVGAYFAGRTLRGPKLWPAVSPGKTWSGALGGLLAAVLVGVLAAAALGRDALAVAVVSIGVAIASQFGDLLESAVKRRWGVKDASRLIPGHGGVMDRLDGILGALWFFALYDLLGGALGA